MTTTVAPRTARTPFGRIELLTRERELELARLARSGDAAARERLILANIPFAMMMATRFHRGYLPGHEDEMKSAALLGLVRGVDRFDPERGNRLITAAAWWIRQAVQEAVEREFHAITVPRRAREDLARSRAGRSPETAKRRELAETAARALAAGPVGCGGNDPIPDFLFELEGPIGGGRASTVDEGDSPLARSLAALEPRTARVLAMRFGLGGGPAMTLEAAGKVVGLTKERVRQIQRDGLARLRDLMADRDEDE